MAFSMDDYKNASASMGSGTLEPGIYEATIISFNEWNNHKGRTLWVQEVKSKKKFNFLIHYTNGINVFKYLNKCLNIDYKGTILPALYLNKKLNITVKVEKSTAVKVDGETLFNIGDFNKKTKQLIKNMNQAKALGYETFEYETNKVSRFDKNDNNVLNQQKTQEPEFTSEEQDLLNDFETGFSLDDGSPF